MNFSEELLWCDANVMDNLDLSRDLAVYISTTYFCPISTLRLGSAQSLAN